MRSRLDCSPWVHRLVHCGLTDRPQCRRCSSDGTNTPANTLPTRPSVTRRAETRPPTAAGSPTPDTNSSQTGTRTPGKSRPSTCSGRAKTRSRRSVSTRHRVETFLFASCEIRVHKDCVFADAHQNHRLDPETGRQYRGTAGKARQAGRDRAVRPLGKSHRDWSLRQGKLAS